MGYSGALLITLAALLLLAFIAIRKGTNSDPIRKSVAAPLSLSATLKNLITERWSPIATGAIVGVLGTIAYLRVEPLGVTRQLSTTARTFMDAQGIGTDTLVGLDRMAGCFAVVAETITNNGWLVIGIIGTSFAAAFAGFAATFAKGLALALAAGFAAFTAALATGFATIFLAGVAGLIVFPLVAKDFLAGTEVLLPLAAGLEAGLAVSFFGLVAMWPFASTGMTYPKIRALQRPMSNPKGLTGS